MERAQILAGSLLVAAFFWAARADAGFRSPESLIRNVYAFYGKGSPAFSNGLPRDEETARQFFDPSLRGVWTALHDAPYDFGAEPDLADRPDLDRNAAAAIRQDRCDRDLRQ